MERAFERKEVQRRKDEEVLKKQEYRKGQAMDRMMKGLGAFALLLLMLLPGMVSGEEKEEDMGAILVKASGVGPLTDAGVAPARKAAIDDALKQAVEQARGVMVQSETLVKDFVTVRDEILSNSKGFVKRYEILQEKKVEADRVYRVEVQTAVLLSDPPTPPVRLDPKNFQTKVPKILGEVNALSRRTDEVARWVNAREPRGFRKEVFIDLDHRYRAMIQLLNSLQAPPGKEPQHERLKEAVNLKAKAIFLYGRYSLKEQDGTILQKANQLNRSANKILLETKKPPRGRPPQTAKPSRS